jgi:hypothetical protein
MYIHKTTGGGSAIVAVAPNEQALRAAYPRRDDLESGINVNRFAVGQRDLFGAVGVDECGVGAHVLRGNGRLRRSAGGAVSDQFWFNPDGTYRWRSSGFSQSSGVATGSTSDERGRWTMNGNWEMTLTRRTDGKVTTLLMAFEAVSGGRILHLTNKNAPGVRFALGLVK